MVEYAMRAAIQVTNQCVIVCNLRRGSEDDAASWVVLRGSADEVGNQLAEMVADAGLTRIADFGGVCKTLLCDGDAYKASPPRVRGPARVFSFTSKNKLVAEGAEMARVAHDAGYAC